MTAADREQGAEAVFEALLKLVCEPDRGRQADLFAEDAVWEFPLAGEREPRRLEGRLEIITGMTPRWAAADACGLQISLSRSRIHHLPDPQEVIAEYTLLISVGSRVEFRNFCQYLRVRGGRIVELREYARPSR